MDSERELDASFFGRDLKTDILSFDSCAAWLGLTDAVREQVCAKDMPRLRKVASEGTIDFTAAIEAKNECDDPTTEMPVEGWSAGTPYVAKVSNAAWLTTPLQGETSESRNATWGEQRRVVYVEIDVEEAGISYSPGDAIGVCVPNPWSLVEEVAKMVKEVRDGETTLTAAVSVRGETKPKTVEAILSYDADLMSVPKKAAVYSLSQCCTDPVEAKNMAWLCSKCAVGKALWAGFVESQGLGLGELIMLFPSCAPTLGALIALAGKPPPRFYSIASSPVAHSRSVACVAFSIVHYTCSLGRDSHASGEAPPLIKRAGLATSYIEQQCAKWLYPGSAVKMTDSSSSSSSGEQEQHHPTLRVFYKPTINFKLPGSVAPPLILIGPGTGVAPFIGFLQHRRHLESQRSKGNRQRSAEDDATMGLWRGGFELEEEELPEELDSVESYIASVPPGDVHLFYGCRNDDDFLFRKELQGFVEDSTLTSLEVAKSRVGEQKQYVTHLMKSRGEELAHTLVRQGGYVYVCGDGNQMAKDVHSALLEVVCEHTEFTEKEGVAFLADLKVRRRYVLDVWS